MSRLDDALREAFQSQDPGPDFTARVLRTAAGARPKEKENWWGALGLRWAMAAALACVLLVGGSIEYRREQEERQGQRAKQQLVLALHIAGAKLNLARDRVQQLNAGD
jgi:predicted acetyltransferase